MRWRVSLALSAIGFLLFGCQAQFGLISTRQAQAAEERLKILSQGLPTVAGAILLDSIEGTGSGEVEGCAIVYVDQLFGTNTLSLGEVLDAYGLALQATVWHPDLETNRGRTFKMSDESNLEVSDNYRFLPFKSTALDEGPKNFKTLFLVALNTPVFPNYPREKCR